MHTFLKAQLKGILLSKTIITVKIVLSETKTMMYELFLNFTLCKDIPKRQEYLNFCHSTIYMSLLSQLMTYKSRFSLFIDSDS